MNNVIKLKTKQAKLKRTKYVYSTSSEVLHLWANQTQDSARMGRSSGGMHGYTGIRCFFDGVSCYSYGRHYELGRLVKHKGHTVAVINAEGRSVTTGKHIREAWNAVENMLRIRCTGIKPVFEGLLEMQGELVDGLMQDLNRRSFWSEYNPFESDYGIVPRIAEFNRTCALLGYSKLTLDLTADFKALIREHVEIRRLVELAKQSPEAVAKRDADKAKRDAKLYAKNIEQVNSWRQGGHSTNFVSSLSPQILRIVNGDTVETSRGAKVPLVDAVEALQLIGRDAARPGDKVGMFTLDRINKDEYGDGIVKIGCHTISLAEAKAVLGNASGGLRLVQPAASINLRA
jgi:hypothetical protein